jgi:glutaconate CoA-transferase subunit B
MSAQPYTGDEILTVAASRAVGNDDICFVGIGQPSAACNLARLTHAPRITLIYESGTIGVRPTVLPLSIGDGELCATALTTVSVPEFFRYWLQSGRITVGFLGAAQIDRFANINTTVIGPYGKPAVRLPGAACPDMAVSCQRIFIDAALDARDGRSHRLRSLFGHGAMVMRAPGSNHTLARWVITDLCILSRTPSRKELTVTNLHLGAAAGSRRHHRLVARFSDAVAKAEPTAAEPMFRCGRRRGLPAPHDHTTRGPIVTFPDEHGNHPPNDAGYRTPRCGTRPSR